MPTCNICGQAIEFRYIGAVCTPIHPHGGCSGSSASGTYGSMPWRIRYSYESFVNPNASCPVCGERVFFYQSILGGRVFFDELGPPRSEERRVGKECRSRWSPYREEKS